MPTTNLPKVSARLETILASAYAPTATTYNLALGTDINGTALAGYYGLTIDGGTANEQFDVVTISGTTCTVVVRDCDPTNPLASRTRIVPTHGKGASVKITDYPLMGFIRSLLNGDYTFDNPLSYTAQPTWITQSTQLATVKKVEDNASQGAADSSTSIKGVTRMSVAPVTSNTPIAVGDNDPRVPTQGENDALVGNNVAVAVGTGNKFVTQTGLQVATETYTNTTGSANAYVATFSPVIGGLGQGLPIRVKANFTNTGPATLNVSGLGAVPILKNGTLPLAAADIVSGNVFSAVYDGANFQLQSPVANNPVSFASGVTSRTLGTTGTQTIAHGLGKAPKYVKLAASLNATGTISSVGTYNGTTMATLVIGNNTFGNSSNTSPASTNTSAVIVLRTNDYSGADATALATIAVDSTNITLTWANGASTPSGTASILWEAFA